MPEPLLIVDHRDGTPQVLSMISTATEQIGDDLPASAESSYGPGSGKDNDCAASNKVINAFGGLYASLADGIYKLQTGSAAGVWSKDSADGGVTFSVGTSSHSYGIFYGVTNNTPYLFGAYDVDATQGNYRAWRLNLLTNTSEETSTIGVSGGATDQVKGSIFYQNTFHTFIKSSGSLATTIRVTLDPLTINGEIITHNAGATTAPGGACYDVFMGNLYRIIARDTASDGIGDWSIEKFTSGAFQSLITFDDLGEGGALSAVKNCLFNDSTNQYVILWDKNTSGWRMYQLDVVAGEISLGSELTSTVLPVAIQAGGVAAVNTGRWWPYKEQQADGSFENILYYSPSGKEGSSADPLTRFKFADNATQLEQQDTGQGTGAMALPEGTQGGGQRIYIPDAATATVYAKERVSGGEKITFRVHAPLEPSGGSVTTGLKVKFFLGTDGGVPETQAQLIGSVTGGSATRNGNQVENIDADGSDYTAIIQPSGFDDFDRVDVVPRLFS